MNETVFCGKGNDVPYADYMKLINDSFGFSTPETEFIGIHPKLYREEYRPQDQNYVVSEAGIPVAAVGAYDHEILVCGRRIPCRGIGNVAVHPHHRSKGYMKMAMNKAVEDMITDGIVLSTLGGQRQRYLHFGYDKAGPVYNYSVTKENVRHVFGDATAPFEVHMITDPADPLIESIMALNQNGPFIPVRPRERYLDIAQTWKACLLTFLQDGEFLGYCILFGGYSVSEIQVCRDGDFLKAIHSLYAALQRDFTVFLPSHQHAYRLALTPVAEDVHVGHAMQFNILDYAAAIDAFLALKLTYETLPDGEMTLLIHGYSRDERIRITVQGSTSRVVRLHENASVDLELSHAEALSLLFSPVSPLHEGVCGLAKIWFPLPLCMCHADEV